MRYFVATMAGAVALTVASAALAQGPVPTPDKRPGAPKSISNVTSENFRNGPLFERAKLAFAAANEGGDTALSAFLTSNASLLILTYIKPQVLYRQTIDSNFIRALIQNCDGPLSYDEGTNWVQLSWMCRLDTEAPISQHYTFRRSREIVMLIDFDGNQIKRIDAMEPLQLPPPPPAGPPPNWIITNPIWDRKPSGEDVFRHYPARARLVGLDGKAIIACSVKDTGALTGCTVVSESPSGYGFGDAAIVLSTRFRMKPMSANGAPVEGLTVRIPMVFRNPNN